MYLIVALGRWLIHDRCELTGEMLPAMAIASATLPPLNPLIRAIAAAAPKTVLVYPRTAETETSPSSVSRVQSMDFPNRYEISCETANAVISCSPDDRSTSPIASAPGMTYGETWPGGRMASKSIALISSPLAKAAPKTELRWSLPRIVASCDDPPTIRPKSMPMRPLGASRPARAQPSESNSTRLLSSTTPAGRSVYLVSTAKSAKPSMIVLFVTPGLRSDRSSSWLSRVRSEPVLCQPESSDPGGRI